ncbi:MAG: hypothetical protein ACP5QX_02800, partial [Caldisericaceae bacterium]
YISTVAVSGNEVAFASGKGMNAINTLKIFNTATNMMTLQLSIDTNTDFAEIGDIEFNANWVLVKVFIDSSHTKAECFAIDRKANKPILLIPYDFEEKHAVVTKIALVQDKAYVAVNFYKKEDEFLLSSNFIDSKIIVVDLSSHDTQVESEETQGYVTDLGHTDKYIVYITRETSDFALSVQDKNLGLKTAAVYRGSFISGLNYISNSSSKSFISCTCDDAVIFANYGRLLLMPLENFKNLQLLPIISNQIIELESASDKYIACLRLGGDILIMNRFNRKQVFIENPQTQTDFLDNTLSICYENLAFIKSSGSHGDSIIFLNLKDNGL